MAEIRVDANRKVVDAASALVNRLREIHDDPEYQAVWTSAQLHMGPYTGPEYGGELAALEAALDG